MTAKVQGERETPVVPEVVALVVLSINSISKRKATLTSRPVVSAKGLSNYIEGTYRVQRGVRNLLIRFRLCYSNV